MFTLHIFQNPPRPSPKKGSQQVEETLVVEEGRGFQSFVIVTTNTNSRGVYAKQRVRKKSLNYTKKIRTGPELVRKRKFCWRPEQFHVIVKKKWTRFDQNWSCFQKGRCAICPYYYSSSNLLKISYFTCKPAFAKRLEKSKTLWAKIHVALWGNPRWAVRK